MDKVLPVIPNKRYFTIGEVSDLCAVKPYVLRYWEQEFTQLRPMKRRGNRRYYQHHEVMLIRRIRALLYDQGFTISGARNRLGDTAPANAEAPNTDQGPYLPRMGGASGLPAASMALVSPQVAKAALELPLSASEASTVAGLTRVEPFDAAYIRDELLSIQRLLND